MITAHLPSGYLLARGERWRGALAAAALVGAVWPDIDLIFFYLVDNRAFHHHRYWVHAPGFALSVTVLLILGARMFRPAAVPLALAFGAGWMLHPVPDTLAGAIMWLWPFNTHLHAFVEVPPTQAHWLLSFPFHWTFLAEIPVWMAALTLLWRRRRRA